MICKRIRLLDRRGNAGVGPECLGPLEEGRARVAVAAPLGAAGGRADQLLPVLVQIARLGHHLVAATQELGEVLGQLLERDVGLLHEPVLELGMVVAQARASWPGRTGPARAPGGTASGEAPPGGAGPGAPRGPGARASPSCWSTRRRPALRGGRGRAGSPPGSAWWRCRTACAAIPSGPSAAERRTRGRFASGPTLGSGRGGHRCSPTPPRRRIVSADGTKSVTRSRTRRGPRPGREGS